MTAVPDSNITIHPAQLLAEVEIRMDRLIPQEKKSALQYLRSYGEVYYAGEIPAEFEHDLHALEAAVWQGK